MPKQACRRQATYRKLPADGVESLPATAQNRTRADNLNFAEQLFSHRDRRIDVLREQVLLSLESIEHRSS